MKSASLVLMALLTGCASTVLRPDLERSATRAALQAALDHEGVAQPPRGDVLDIDTVEPEPARTPMAIREAEAPARTQEAPAQTASETESAKASAQASMDSPGMTRALEDLTREMSEQRMLMMMQMMSQRGSAPVVVDDSGRMTDLAVAVQRLQDAQEAQSEGSAAMLQAIEALRQSLEERVPVDNAARLEAMEASVVGVPDALQEIRDAQEVLRERIERLEGLHEAAPVQIVTPPPVLIPVEPEPEPEPVETVEEASPTDAVEEDPEPAPVEEDAGDERRAERQARREERRQRRAEWSGEAERERVARARAREEALAQRAEAASTPAATGTNRDETTVAIVPIPAAQVVERDDAPCIPADPDVVRFPLDERALARLARLQENEAVSTDPPEPVPLPEAPVCTDAQ